MILDVMRWENCRDDGHKETGRYTYTTYTLHETWHNVHVRREGRKGSKKYMYTVRL